VRTSWDAVGHGPDINMEFTQVFTVRKGRIVGARFSLCSGDPPTNAARQLAADLAGYGSIFGDTGNERFPGPKP
jgi:hypothetical protein